MKQLEKLIKSTETAQQAGGRLHTFAEAYGFLRMDADHTAEELQVLQMLVEGIADRSEGPAEVMARLQRIVTTARLLAASAIETAAIAQRAIPEIEGWSDDD